ncbi:membrane associated rhomboid family serine protease [Mesonia hippocampi]|uniref:Membrane associated rhomboid family serine protease n=1 Tax=Mesonia hippocampi TaxID=1628250 RepID=A0A840EF58_9FLAO|nr:rhomboid family intramembrane serine protease [Mesonia hippocampi]MBB4117822.1 membrane associated rhomboid family serine protease [Mesonia hippocampi]
MNMITLTIIAINVILSIKGFNDAVFFEKYKFNIGAIQRGEKIRLLTSGFLHVDVSHLFLNMLTLYFFADVVIHYLGNIGFVLVYLGSLILGNLVSLFFHKKEYYYSAVGASGAVMGVLYASILLQPDMMLGLFFLIPIPAYIFGIGYLLYSIYGMKNRMDNIGHDAHFGGAMGGYFITLIINPWVITQHTLMTILLVIPIIILFVLQRKGKL